MMFSLSVMMFSLTEYSFSLWQCHNYNTFILISVECFSQNRNRLKVLLYTLILVAVT